MNGDFIYPSIFLNFTYSSFLGILTVCLALVLKKSLNWVFNIPSVMKTCKQ